MKKKLLFISLISSHCVLAQIPATSNWFSLQLQEHISNKWQWVFDAGYRTIGMSAAGYGYNARGGLKYSFNEVWSATMGTALFFTRSSYQKSNHEFGREFRIWQELSMHKPISESFSLYSRFRTEERWFEATIARHAYFGLRFRERLTVIKALSKKWNLEFGDEYMRMLAENRFMFNSNRIIFSVMYKMKNEKQLQAGYLWMKLPVSSQHIFSFTFHQSIAVKQKKNSAPKSGHT